jgi:hypothetical protein
MTDWLRLAFGTAVVLAPGWAVARALGRRGTSATLGWGLAVIAFSLAVTFLVHGSLALALLLELAVGAAAVTAVALRLGRLGRKVLVPTQFTRPNSSNVRTVSGAAAGASVRLLGLAFGVALWSVCGPVGGDGLFHLARVRKLDAFGDLSLRAVGEFRDGGLHPGYAFPLWHGFLALVAKVAGLDPTVVVRHEPSLLAPLAFAVAFEAGRAVFGRAWGGWAALLGSVALYALAPGHGGAYVVLTNPGTAVRQLLAPAAIALFFVAVREGGWRPYLTLAALAGASALVHPAFTAFMLLPLGGYAVARTMLVRGRDLRETAAALAAFALPLAGVLAWLRPLVRETAAVSPSAAERTRALHQYRDQLVVHGDSYRLSADVIARGGAVAVAALVSVPLAVLAPTRRWAALVLGGSLVVLALALVPSLFTQFADAVSLSQARRAAGFLPFPFAFAGGMWALARLGALALPLALAAGVLLQRAWPGDFGGRVVTHGGPAAATWIALAGGAVALAVATVWRPRPADRGGALAALAAALFVLPVAVHGFAHWSAAGRVGARELPPALVAALRHEVPAGAAVFADLETSYRISAYAPLYVAAAPPAHVANTKANQLKSRLRRVRRFFRTGDLAIPRGFGATWVLLDRTGKLKSLPLPKAYADPRYVLYRLRR